MEFKTTHRYHIFNRGNNKEKIFFSVSNYYLFIDKMKNYLLPYGDIIAWCLMPNHFHLMMEINVLEVDNKLLNDSIGRLLCTYTRAINKQEVRTGSLFQKHTKAICLTGLDKPPKLWYRYFGATMMINEADGFDYPTRCFKYIHANPVKAGLVEKPENWRFSSYREYINKTNYGLINREKGQLFF